MLSEIEHVRLLALIVGVGVALAIYWSWRDGGDDDLPQRKKLPLGDRTRRNLWD